MSFMYQVEAKGRTNFNQPLYSPNSHSFGLIPPHIGINVFIIANSSALYNAKIWNSKCKWKEKVGRFWRLYNFRRHKYFRTQITLIYRIPTEDWVDRFLSLSLSLSVHHSSDSDPACNFISLPRFLSLVSAVPPANTLKRPFAPPMTVARWLVPRYTTWSCGCQWRSSLQYK